MRGLTRAVFITGLFASASCSTSPEVRLAVQPDGTRCATVRERLDASTIRPLLLFFSAQTTLELGGRHFRVTGFSGSGATLNAHESLAQRGSRPQEPSISVPEASVCFQLIPASVDSPNIYDSRLVLLNADPTLRARLSPAAQRQLKALDRAQP